MKCESEVDDALIEFIQHVGIPHTIHTDGAKALTMRTWKQICKIFHMKTTATEPNSPWQNRAEAGIQ
jgi:hypothetical protein